MIGLLGWPQQEIGWLILVSMAHMSATLSVSGQALCLQEIMFMKIRGDAFSNALHNHRNIQAVKPMTPNINSGRHTATALRQKGKETVSGVCDGGGVGEGAQQRTEISSAVVAKVEGNTTGAEGLLWDTLSNNCLLTVTRIKATSARVSIQASANVFSLKQSRSFKKKKTNKKKVFKYAF